MAKRTERTEANDSTTAAPPAQPAKGPGRARSARQTAGADTFAARPEPSRDPSDDAPRDEPMVETRAESAEATRRAPSEEDIRQRAYERYLERGGGHGMDFEDWLEAERELKSQK